MGFEVRLTNTSFTYKLSIGVEEDPRGGLLAAAHRSRRPDDAVTAPGSRSLDIPEGGGCTSVCGRPSSRARSADRSLSLPSSEKETKSPADSLQKQGPGPGGHVFRKGRLDGTLRLRHRISRTLVGGCWNSRPAHDAAPAEAMPRIVETQSKFGKKPGFRLRTIRVCRSVDAAMSACAASASIARDAQRVGGCAAMSEAGSHPQLPAKRLR